MNCGRKERGLLGEGEGQEERGGERSSSYINHPLYLVANSYLLFLYVYFDSVRLRFGAGRWGLGVGAEAVEIMRTISHVV